jgi:DNA-binding NarL/FixJ family response regulator
MKKNVNSKNPKRKPWTVPHQTKAKVMRLLATGMSQRKVARETGLSTTTVNYMADPQKFYERATAYRLRTRAARLKRMKEYYRTVIKPRNDAPSKE